MIRNRRAKRVAVAVLVVSIMFALNVSAVASDTFTQTVKVTQSAKQNPTKTDYTYVLTPYSPGNPMPNGTKDGKYSFEIKGATTADEQEFSIVFDATQPGNYLYYLRRQGTIPTGESVTPEEHCFGFLVEEQNGKMVIIPYTCYDNHMVIWDKTDTNGNPIGITLSNEIVGKSTVSPTPTPTAKVTTSPATTNSLKGQYTPKTGDNTPLSTLIIMAVFSVIMVVFLVLIDRRREKKEGEE